jgi:flagellar biosynthetic protein FliQ
MPMNDQLQSLAAQSLSHVLVLSAPTVLAGLGVGFLISLFQAVTQIQEQTLTFVPKIIVVFLVLLLTGSWMVSSISDFAHETLDTVAVMARS